MVRVHNHKQTYSSQILPKTLQLSHSLWIHGAFTIILYCTIDAYDTLVITFTVYTRCIHKNTVLYNRCIAHMHHNPPLVCQLRHGLSTAGQVNQMLGRYNMALPVCEVIDLLTDKYLSSFWGW